MKVTMVSLTCIGLVKDFEGCRLAAYQCPAGVWTIGYGATGAGIGPGVTWTQEQADQRLRDDLERVAAAVDGLVTVPLAETQRDALISFVFNIGVGAFKYSTLRRKMNAGDVTGAAAEFARWTRGGGKVLPGLVRRRAAEAAWFLAGREDPMAQAVSPNPMKPLTESRTIGAAKVAAGAAIGIGAVTEIIGQVQPLVGEVREVIVLAQTASALGPWLVAVALAVGLGYVVWRRIDDHRQQEN